MRKIDEEKKPNESAGNILGTRRIVLPKTQSHKVVGMAFAVSLLLHIAVVTVLWLLPEKKVDKKSRALEIWLAEPKKPPTKPDAKKTVVSMTAPKNNKQPDVAHYFADHDSSTNKETKEKITSTNKLETATQPSPKENTVDVADDDVKPLTSEHFLKRKPPLKNNDPLGILPKSAGKIVYGKGATEHLPSVADGDKTELNAWQWRHAPFFNRIKSRIGRVWSPALQISRYDPGGSLLGHKDRVTLLSVTIDQEGALKDLAVTDSSGVAYLDEEAERAIKTAAPFPFPPKELFDESGEFSFSFAFHLQVNRGYSFDFEWQKDQ